MTLSKQSACKYKAVEQCLQGISGNMMYSIIIIYRIIFIMVYNLGCYHFSHFQEGGTNFSECSEEGLKYFKWPMRRAIFLRSSRAGPEIYSAPALGPIKNYFFSHWKNSWIFMLRVPSKLLPKLIVHLIWNNTVYSS